jgi:anti-sigma factor RsiW
MTCPDVQALAGSYLDGELPEEMCSRIQRHALQCAACRSELGSLRMAAELLRTTQATPAPREEFIESALSRLRMELEIGEKSAEAPGQLVLGIRDVALT